jgi:hypothetical protein
MPKDKYTAVWLSHSSISDYLKCPRSYFLKNIYKDPKSRRKIALASPALSLGQTVHEVVESLSCLPASERLIPNLTDQFLLAWTKISGKKGGFKSAEEEEAAKVRGQNMLSRIGSHPGPIIRPAIKIRQDLPYFWLLDEDNVILCGKIDWLEYLPDADGVNIIDFKTGKYDEDPDSLQLPIYLLLASHTQTKPVLGAAYWYLDRDDEPTAVKLPDLESAEKSLVPLAKKIALARKLQHFSCPQIHGCRACQPYEAVLSGQAELVDVRENKDVYLLP